MLVFTPDRGEKMKSNNIIRISLLSICLILLSFHCITACVPFQNESQIVEPGKTSQEADPKIIEANLTILRDSGFLSDEGVGLLSDAIWQYSDYNQQYNYEITFVKETSVVVEETVKQYIEVVSVDGTHLFFYIPGYKTKYASFVQEIWKDEVGKTYLLLYVDD